MAPFILILGLLRLTECQISSYNPSAFAIAFAGGFGGGSKDISKKKSGGKKRKGGLSDLSTKPSQVVVKAPETATSEPQLDKWGLPPATEDDLFPPMPPGIELIPVDTSAGITTLEDIQNCMKDHIDLSLDRFFDENGAEKRASDRDPMKLRLLHKSPPVLSIDNFFTAEECLKTKSATDTAHHVNSATFAGALSTRTSTSWFCRYSDLPVLLAKVNNLLNIPLETMEEPQVVRYQKGQEFSYHYDEVPAPQLENGGQRVATLLVYLSDISDGCGGETMFRDLQFDEKSLTMRPKAGSALLFFPAFRDGTPDDRTLHRSEAMTCDDEKWIVQMWIHEKSYQAVLPSGNSNTAAQSVMEQASHDLGYA